MEKYHTPEDDQGRAIIVRDAFASASLNIVRDKDFSSPDSMRSRVSLQKTFGDANDYKRKSVFVTDDKKKKKVDKRAYNNGLDLDFIRTTEDSPSNWSPPLPSSPSSAASKKDIDIEFNIPSPPKAGDMRSFQLECMRRMRQSKDDHKAILLFKILTGTATKEVSNDTVSTIKIFGKMAVTELYSLKDTVDGMCAFLD